MNEAMVVHRILCEFTGEVSTSPSSPIAPWTEQVDLSERKDFIFTNDDWRLVGGPRYEVREVTLPQWLGAREWISRCTEWRYTWGMGADASWPESWQRALMEMDQEGRHACIKLLTVKDFRSAFRVSLRAQLVAWMEDTQRARVFSWLPGPEYPTPFSKRQWESLLDGRTVRESRNAGTSLYYHRSAPGVLVPSHNAAEQQHV